MVTNIYQNIPTDEKIKLYIRFCDYIAKEQNQYEERKEHPEQRTNPRDNTHDTRNNNHKCVSRSINGRTNQNLS